MPDAVLLAILFGIPFTGSFLVSYFLHKKLVREGNKSPRLISILAFAGCFVLLFALVVLVLISTIRLDR